MKVCLFSWNPSDSLSFASPCLSPLLLVYLFTEACEKRGATGNFLRGWCWQMVRASSVLNSALWIPEFCSVLETEQLQPLNKTCVFHIALIHWADKHLCYWTYWSLLLQRQHLIWKPKGELYQQNRGVTSLVRTSSCPCSVMMDLALSCTSTRWWQTPEWLWQRSKPTLLSVYLICDYHSNSCSYKLRIKELKVGARSVFSELCASFFLSFLFLFCFFPSTHKQCNCLNCVSCIFFAFHFLHS